MNNFVLPNLDKCVLSALDLFSKKLPPKLKANNLPFIIVVGSGNAYNAGKVMFGNQAALFASESDLRETINQYRDLFKKKIIKEALVISASGEKDSIWEINFLKKIGLKTSLLTCSPNSSAAHLADVVYCYDKLAEPYTYNVSTYLGMILSITNEKAKSIKAFIKTLKFPELKKYRAYAFILPDKYAAAAQMINIKGHELFGPHLLLRAFTYGEARHAKFVHVWKHELVISLGENKYFGHPSHRWSIKLPAKGGAGLVMALSYYIVGKIQALKPAYYKKSIIQFCQTGPKAYGSKQPFAVIVK